MSMNEIETIVRETMTKFEVPGLVMLSQRGNDRVVPLVFGADAAGVSVERDSLFIVASITKLATALTVLRLVDAGQAGLDDPLANYLPMARAAQDGVTLRTMLCHTAGLPMDLPNQHELYGKATGWKELGPECLKVELEMPPRTRVVYGNVGYGLLGLVVEEISADSFLNSLRKLVLQPLGIEGYLGDEPPRESIRLADVQSRHVGTDIEPYNSPYYRGLGLPWSGLVTNADGALRLVRAFAGNPPNFLSEALQTEATRNQTGDLPGGYGGRFDYPHSPWGLGADLKGDKKPHWTPPNASPRTFGHAGASGCVAWHDPDKNVSWAILGTRTADNGWLVRGAPKIAEALLNEAEVR